MTAPRHNAPPASPEAAALRARNRLGNESSPYLLQHRENPVAWRPWGEEAFAEAAERGVPIFLSIGYATCYWCHVMERESFEDPAIGALMSERFVCVKVDREQRPDVDDIYMAAVQALSGRGGWPMSVFLTPPGARTPDDPGLEPIWGGTYFPPEPRHGLPSFRQLLEGISEAWGSQRDVALKQAGAVTEVVRERLGATAAPVRIGAADVSRAAGELLRMYDAAHGGFGGAPKFPQPVFLEYLLDVIPGIEEESARTAAMNAVRHTLDRMALGGMFDQVGGGFHRYSVDAEWVVPHFEKMLYDNAQLGALYARAWSVTGDPFDAYIARRTLDYALREMASERGAFYSAQDAEVDGQEGLNYLWTPDEVRAALPPDDAAFAIEAYGLDRPANFQDPHHPDAPPRHILTLRERPDRMAARLGVRPDDVLERLGRINAALYDVRNARKQPLLDDKTLASWNGLMIAALADAGAALGERRYIEAAAAAAGFVWDRMRDDRDLLRVWRSGAATTKGVLEDYAMLAQGLLSLHKAWTIAKDAERAQDWLERAMIIVGQAKVLFADLQTGAWHDTRPGARDLLVRARSMHDGAVPSATSVLLHNLLDLHAATRDETWLDDAGRLLAASSAAIHASPLGCVNATRALLRVLRNHPGLIETHGMIRDATPAAEDDDAGDAHEISDPPVEVYADKERVDVGDGAPGEINLELRIREGWHITAHEPFAPGTPEEERVPGLIGLRVEVRGGEGVRAVVRYPTGEPLHDGASEDDEPLPLPPLMVHEGSLRLSVSLQRDGKAWSGRPLLYVAYQPCTDRECLAPMTAELDVAIDPV
ncbi:MAG: DUF255 domain-containing protein [Phycisphaerales bacterium]|nr:MAG: DUF255 domain-containing protein [Phycisphaerales bacterium]